MSSPKRTRDYHQEVNVWAPWLFMAQVLPGMRSRGRGWILNTTSFSGELPPGPPFPFYPPFNGLYGATKAALNRLTVAAAAENYGYGIAVRALAPQAGISTDEAIATSGALNEGKPLRPNMLEPAETMTEAALALCTADPMMLTGRVAYSLQLLIELNRGVYDLRGEALVEGWQPADLPAEFFRRQTQRAADGWCTVPYKFHRPNTPYPDVLESD